MDLLDLNNAFDDWPFQSVLLLFVDFCKLWNYFVFKYSIFVMFLCDAKVLERDRPEQGIRPAHLAHVLRPIPFIDPNHAT